MYYSFKGYENSNIPVGSAWYFYEQEKNARLFDYYEWFLIDNYGEGPYYRFERRGEILTEDEIKQVLDEEYGEGEYEICDYEQDTTELIYELMEEYEGA